jgi:CheY-like chemotaxis protein
LARDVVVTDRAMPGMGRFALAEALIRKRPGLPMPIFTGQPTPPAELAARLRRLAQSGGLSRRGRAAVCI